MAEYKNLGQGMAAQKAGDPKDRTFLYFTPEQAATYAKQRGTYSPALYQTILDHHTATGGKLSTRLDVGCGPGNSIRDLAAIFDKTIGIDPSPEMLKRAELIEDDPVLGASAQKRCRITYLASSAEDIAKLDIAHASADLITVATAAHWFEMPAFYAAAAKLLAPGGTLAIWTNSRHYPHPTTPNYEAIRKVMDHLEFDVLGPYTTPGNVLARNGYRDLDLPWTVTPRVDEFPEADFKRIEWNKDGACARDEEFFIPGRTDNINIMAKVLGTASQVTRWREAHPDLAGTDRDAVQSSFAQVKALLGPETQTMKNGAATHLLMFKRR